MYYIVANSMTVIIEYDGYGDVFFKQKTAYEMRISDWSSDVCSSDLKNLPRGRIVKDETLADLAAHPPKQQDGLGGVRGLSATWKANDIGGRLMDALAAAQPLAKDDMPDRAPRGTGLGQEGAPGGGLLKLLLKIRARELNVAARLRARTDDMEALGAGRGGG